MLRLSLAWLCLQTLALAPPLNAQAVPPVSRSSDRSPPTIAPPVFAQLRYRYIGPEGNRLSAVAGVPNDPATYYAGAASGGVWKTTDGGVHWVSVFDDQPVSSIGALAIATSDPNIVWVGTGESFIRSNISIGWGVYKSIDAGRSWVRMGLEKTGRIARVVVDPRDPDIVFVAALGHAYGPQPERGIYRTIDGGKTWTHVLFVNDSTGASDLAMDPNDARVLYAGTWQLELHTWGRESGGAGSAIWKSKDGGTTWTRLTGNGLPTRSIGKVGLAIARSNPHRVFALIETGDGVPWRGQETDSGRLFRSDDDGSTWSLVSHDRQVAGRTHYYNRMAVAPDNADEAYFLANRWAKTIDGGRTFIDARSGEVPGGDFHDIWIDPTNANRMILSHDHGVSITTNRGRSWMPVELPVAQMYHVTVDNRIPYNVYGNRQDGPSTMGPSNSNVQRDDEHLSIIPRALWRTVGGDESGWATPDPVDSNLVWSSGSGYGSVGGVVTRFDVRTSMATNVEVWPQSTIGWPADGLRYRFGWTFPLTISPHDHNLVYVGSQFVHATTDSGRTWRVISPDLTRNDKSRQRSSGGLTPDNVGVEYAGVVFAIAESPRVTGIIWAGTNDGRVHLTRNGGTSWTDVSASIPGLISWGTISNIEPSRFDAGTCYLTVDAHQVNNRDPWVYKTTDYGKTWTLITTGLPRTPLSYAHVIREDPVRQGLLYLGTENGLYVSFDDGASWQPLQNNLPHAPVYWLTVQEHFSDLVVSTYGRGFWILDDVTPLRQLTTQTAARGAHLFAPRVAYRFREAEAPLTVRADPVTGDNPPYGAPINYWLASDGADSVSLRILDARGAVVRTLAGPAKAGVNRVWWDLRFELSPEARIRMARPYAPWFAVGPEGRPAPSVGRYAILAPPARYTVKLVVNGQPLTETLVVRKDPRSGGSDAEIRVQMELAGAIQADLERTVAMINTMERIRHDIAARRVTLRSDAAAADVRVAADSLDRSIVGIEDSLFQVAVTGRGQDFLRWPVRVAEQLVYLASSVGSSDFAPTKSQREVWRVLHAGVLQASARLDHMLQRDVAAFNGLLRRNNMSEIAVQR